MLVSAGMCTNAEGRLHAWELETALELQLGESLVETRDSVYTLEGKEGNRNRQSGG